MSASPPPEESTALILIHDDDEDGEYGSPFSTDDDEEEQHSNTENNHTPPPPALRPSLAFLHLLSPYLKLGALLLPSSGLPLSHGLPALLLCAAAAALANYLSFMLGRYFRKPDWEGVVLEVFARGHGPTKERTRGILRSAVRLGAGVLRVCIAAIYVRKSVHAFGNSFSMFLSRPAAVVCAVILVAPFSYARSPTARTVTCATVGSVLAYLAWLGCISYAYARGTLDSNTGYIQLGTLWQGITVTAFAFTSSFSLPAFKSAPTSALSTATPRPTRRRLLRTLAVILAVLLLLPSVLFAAFPHPPPPGIPPRTLLQQFTAALYITSLLLGIPAILATAPALPVPAWVTPNARAPMSRSLLILLVALVGNIPTPLLAPLMDVILVCALLATYFLPAALHIAAHMFKRPISIILPQSLSVPPSASSSSFRNLSTPVSPLLPAHARSQTQDELLLRKERALQRRQQRRRIIWDVAAWLLVGVTVAGSVWAVHEVGTRGMRG